VKMHAPFYHFSVDDVFDAFMEVADRQLSLFDQPFFRFLRHLNLTFGTHTSLYLFYRKELAGRMRTLTHVPSSLKITFSENPWLRLGPHALDYKTPPYAQSPQEQMRIFDTIYAEIERFAGPQAVSKWVRLHYFSESYELAEYFRTKGVTALLSTDKEAISYRLPAYAKESLKNAGTVTYEGMTFVRSHLRIENLLRDPTLADDADTILDSLLARSGYSVIMTHENEISSAEVRDLTEKVLRYFKNREIYSW
jgi:hypothetical protein